MPANEPGHDNIEAAVRILGEGGLVAFPTETVYGLGADATNDRAVHRVFIVKGRPATNPLIVHVADESMARRYARVWTEQASRLAGAFWPGPLTLVLPRSHEVSDLVTAGRDTVGLRSPNHPLALALLHRFGRPVAAPSANRFMRLSPTSARHVLLELNDRVDLILDGGACPVGIESTVLDLAGVMPTILRPGAILQRDIEALIGPVAVFRGQVDVASTTAASPGQHAVHYAPQRPAHRFARRDLGHVAVRVAALRATALLSVGRLPEQPLPATCRVIEMPCSAPAYAQRLYAALREADDGDAQAIFVEMPPDEPAWSPVRDRIQRATTPL